MFAELRVYLTDPNGDKWDLTDRCIGDSMDRVTAQTESDLLQLTHSDIDLDFDDRDGAVSALFLGCSRGQTYQLEILRETGKRRPKYERVFGGVLDVPQSIRFDRKEKVVSLQAFAWSKVAEFYSAETIKRTFPTEIATVTASSASFTSVSDTSLFQIGDLFTVDDGNGNTQQFTIKTIDSATALTSTAVASTGYSGATLTIDTPYYRNKTVDQLAALLFAAAGITEYNTDIAQELSTVPFPSTPSTSGLVSTATVLSILENTTNALSIYAGTTVHRYDASTVTGGFTDAGADTVKADWRPYRTTAPAALRASAADDGRRAWDYDGNHYYSLSSSGSPRTLTLSKDGSTIATLDTCPAAPGYDHPYKFVEYDPTSGYVYVSFARGFTDPADPVETILSNYTTARYDTSGNLIDTLSATCGQLRACKTTASVAWFEGASANDSYPLTFDQRCQLFDTNGAVLLSLGKKTGVIGWTFRAMGTSYLAVRSDGISTFVTVWSQTDGTVLGDYQISSSPSTKAYATVFDAGSTVGPYYWAYGGGSHYIVSTVFSGVIPYANFEGMSVAAALRELALVSGSHFWVDEEKTGHILGRKSATLLNQVPRTLPDPMTQIEMPVWEWLRSGVRLTGKDEFGADIEVTNGNLGDSAATLEISLKIPITSGLAAAIASAYYNYLGTSRSQFDETIPEPDDGAIRLLEIVERDGHQYVVLRAETDYMQREQTLQLADAS